MFWPLNTLLRLGPYMRRSGRHENSTWTRLVTCSMQIEMNRNTKKTQKNQRHANPPARFAFRHSENCKANSKRGKSPKTPTQIDLPLDTVVQCRCVDKSLHANGPVVRQDAPEMLLSDVMFYFLWFLRYFCVFFICLCHLISCLFFKI